MRRHRGFGLCLATALGLGMALVSCKAPPGPPLPEPQTAVPLPAEVRPEFVLVPNPGFEAPKEDWIQDWDLWLGSAKDAVRDTQVFHSGSASLRLTGPAWVASALLPYNGEELTLSAWVRTANVKGGPEPWAKPGISVNGYDESRNPITSRDLVRLVGTQPWRKYQMTAVLSDAVRYIRVVCFMSSPAQGTIWFDDIDLTLRQWRNPGLAELAYTEEQCAIEVAADKPIGPCSSVWAGADAGLAEGILVNPVRDALPRLCQAGFRLIRLRETLHGLRIYSEDGRGRPAYDWTRLDRILDILTRQGFQLVFVLGTTPDDIAGRVGPRPWRNISPPRDLNKWAELVFQVVRHCEERCGKKAVEQWYWEVWNEPDTPENFQGSQSDYFALYDYTASAVKRANPRARVGGPATHDHTWLPAFIAHCAQGKNAATGETGAPVDFFSWHLYTASRGPAAAKAAEYSIQEVRNILAAYPTFRDKELVISQWNLSPRPNDLADGHYEAAFAARMAQRFVDCGVSAACYFCIADGPVAGNELFRGDLGLITMTGVDKAVLNAFRLLSLLEPTRLPMTIDTQCVDGLATLSTDGRRLAILLSNYVDAPHANFVTDATMRITGLPFPAGRVQLRRYLIDATRSNAYSLWKDLGSPARPTALQIRALNKNAQLEIVQEQFVTVSEKGVLNLSMRLPVHSVTLIVLERLTEPTPPK